MGIVVLTFPYRAKRTVFYTTFPGEARVFLRALSVWRIKTPKCLIKNISLGQWFGCPVLL